jgi:Alginate export
MLNPLILSILLSQVPALKSAPTPPPPPPVPVEVNSFKEFFTKGKFGMDYRLRYESVDDDGFAVNATAITLRSRNGFRTAAVSGFSAYVESESVYALREDYNSTANSKTQFPTIVDPEGTEFNQVYLAYGFNTPTQVIVGRQRIAYDNQRFFGNVGFRQNEQTFDAATVNIARNGFAGKFAYLDKVHRIFGNSNPNQLLRQQDLDAVLLNGSYQFQASAGKPLAGSELSIYSYFVKNQDLPLSSAKTFGARYSGGLPVTDTARWFYTLELAQQDAYRNGNANIDADYSLIETGMSFESGRYSIKAVQETLGSNQGRSAFQTPFATLHAFNGWADRFLVTPNNGLRDRYLDASAKFGPGTLGLQWHLYDSDFARKRLGKEWGVQYLWPINDQLTTTFKAADYSADSFGKDTVKLWLFFDYKR